MLNASTWQAIEPWRLPRPLLVVVVDTEAEFDWKKGSPRRAVGVRSARNTEKAHRILQRYGARPTYVLDYPISSNPEGYLPIRDILQDGGCEIGAHLQPWDTPPVLEWLTDRNSYPGNLPAELEREKLVRLTESITRNLGVRPRIYKAGRYGVGQRTPDILRELGYEIDVSVLPGTDLSATYGPNFSHCDAHPYWFDTPPRLFEIPLSIGYAGLLARYGNGIHRCIRSRRMEALHVPGILARLGLLERIILTPEGVTFEEQRRLTRSMLSLGYRVFSLTYHSPSLLPGNTPYVRTERDLDEFLGRIEQYLAFFTEEVGGVPATPFEVKAAARETGSEAPVASA